MVCFVGENASVLNRRALNVFGTNMHYGGRGTRLSSENVRPIARDDSPDVLLQERVDIRGFRFQKFESGHRRLNKGVVPADVNFSVAKPPAKEYDAKIAADNREKNSEAPQDRHV